MRLLVASDSHRAAGNLLDIVELHLEDSDVLLFLGDGENDLENVRMLYPGCIFCKWPGIAIGAATCPPGAQPNWAAKRCFIPTATRSM